MLLKENQVGRVEGALIKIREFVNNELVVMRQPPQVPAPAPPVDEKGADDAD